MTAPHPPLIPEATADPDVHFRAGTGIPHHHCHTPRLYAALRALRARAIPIALTLRPHQRRCRYRSITITVPTLFIALQLPADLPQVLTLPRIRTELGEGALHSPAPTLWERTHGTPCAQWAALTTAAPDQPWHPTRPWTEVHLEITDPTHWLEHLVHRLDVRRTHDKARAQHALF